MSEHTALPWFVADDRITILASDSTKPTGVSEIALTLAYRYDRPDAEVIANAEYIVRAANHHEELVAQLERWLSWWDGSPNDEDSVPALLSQTEALLSKVAES